MMDWMTAASFTICGALMAVMALGVAFSAFMPTLDRWNRRYFITFFSLLFLYVVVIFIDVIIFPFPNMAKEQRIVMYFEYLLFSVLTLMPMPLVLHSCEESIKNNKLFRGCAALWVIFCIFLFPTKFTNAFYYTTQDLQYVRGPWFPLMIAPLFIITLLNVMCLFFKRKNIAKDLFVELLIYLAPTSILVVVYMFAAVDILISFWMVLCAITLFGLILTKSVKEYMCQQREIAQQRASIMVLQMRPHFIYNTLMTIYSLCNQDAQKARQVTMDFTNYLRKNFNAVASETPIPFSAELEHTRAYLAVEQAQFEEMLLVEYDTPHTRFRVPPLTLQPIVENAVKHGRDPYLGPLHISIRTRETNAGSEIIVENDGADLKAANDNNEPYTALANIRQRLNIMCRGELTITPRDGGGTVVRVTIPYLK